MILFTGRSWRWTRAMCGSNGKRALVMETTVTGVTLLGFSRTCLAALTSVSRAVSWVILMWPVVTVLLTVFEREDNIAIDRKLCGINFKMFRRISNMCWSKHSMFNGISSTRLSATRNLALTCKSPSVVWSSSYPKFRTALFADISGAKLVFSLKGSFHSFAYWYSFPPWK